MPTATATSNRIVWFEIPAADLDRSTRFYGSIFDEDPKIAPFGTGSLAVLPYEKPNVSGCIMAAPELKPSRDGVVVYLNAEPSLGEVLARVETAGGKIVQAATALPEGMGFYAKILDTEGNIVGLHSMA